MSLLSDYQSMASGALSANQARKKEITGYLDDIVRMYGGGEYLLTNQESKQYDKLQSKAAAGELKPAQQRKLDKLQGKIGTDTFGESYRQEIERNTQKLVSSGLQQLMSSGMYGTTVASSVPKTVATEYAEPARLKLEDLLMERTAGALTQKASFLERIEEPYPDLAPLMQAYQAQASVPPSTGTSPSERPGWSLGYGTPVAPRTANVTPTIGATGAAPTPGGGYSAAYYEQKRLADEKKLQALAAAGKIY